MKEIDVIKHKMIVNHKEIRELSKGEVLIKVNYAPLNSMNSKLDHISHLEA